MKSLNEMTPLDAALNIFDFAMSNRLVRESWHSTNLQGEQTACLLGAIHAGVTAPHRCPSTLMPQWLSLKVPHAFDNLNDNEVTEIGAQFADYMARWSVLTPDQWETVRDRTDIDFQDERFFHSLFEALDSVLPPPVTREFEFTYTVKIPITESSVVKAHFLAKQQAPAGVTLQLKTDIMPRRPTPETQAILDRDDNPEAWPQEFINAVRETKDAAKAKGVSFNHDYTTDTALPAMREFWGWTAPPIDLYPHAPNIVKNYLTGGDSPAWTSNFNEALKLTNAELRKRGLPRIDDASTIPALPKMREFWASYEPLPVIPPIVQQVLDTTQPGDAWTEELDEAIELSPGIQPGVTTFTAIPALKEHWA